MARNPNPIDDKRPAERLRAAVIKHGPVNLPNLARILGISGREVWSHASSQVKRGFLEQDAKGQLSFIRHPTLRRRLPKTPSPRNPPGVRGRPSAAILSAREKDYSTRQDNASKAQAITRKQLGLRDMPDERLPCTETWLAANADKYERLPSSGPRAVSPASRLRYTYG